VIDWPIELANEGAVLESGGQALAILLIAMGLFHLLFRNQNSAFSRANLIAQRIRYPTLLLVFTLPTYWLCLRVPNLLDWFYTARAALNCNLALISAEMALSLLLDGPQGPRISYLLQRFIRLPLYVAALIVVVSTAIGLPLFELEFQIRVLAVVMLFAGMHFSHVFLFRFLTWHHSLLVALRDRLRLWAYGLLVGTVVYFATIHLKIWTTGSYQIGYLKAALGFILGSALSESMLVCLFDFYFPKIRQIEVPQLFRDLARGVAFLVVLAFTAVVFLHRDLGSLLVGSAVLSVAIGFALQETLGNFFAGLALRLAHPYSLGDRVEIMQYTGSVQKIDWRSTALINNQGDLIIIPNSKLAQEAMINHSSPSSATGRFIEIGLHYRHAPNQCIQVLLEAVNSVPEVLSAPTPEVYIMNFADSALNYRVRFFIDDFSERFRVDSKVREAIWYHTNRANIEIPFPIRNVYHLEPSHGPDLVREVKSLLDTVDFFSILGQEDLEQLAKRATLQMFAKGEMVCVQGQPGDCFYIIKSGLLTVKAVDAQGTLFLSVEMRPGQYFGEMALLTGEPRSASVEASSEAELLRLGKEDLRHLFRLNSQVETMISKRLAERQLSTTQAMVEAQEERLAKSIQSNSGDERVEQLTQQFLRKIRDFFSY
jgi:small-conductance mechanosensitive channel/CRP-like cAMP-binding protein